MTKNFEQIIEEHQVLLERDVPVEDVVVSLHASGLNIIESIKAVRLLYNLSLKNAHKVVASHSIWASMGHRSKSLR